MSSVAIQQIVSSENGQETAVKNRIAMQRIVIKGFLMAQLEAKQFYEVQSDLVLLFHARCKFKVLTYNRDFYEMLDIRPLAQLLNDKPFTHYTKERDFDDDEGYYCTVNVWDKISFALEGSLDTYQIQKLIVVDFIEPGHCYPYEVFVVI